jgi:tRNA threonylcarbamoyladenosine biosynthesis protein TsaB
MILYLDTSDKTCKIYLDDTEYAFETDRNLARDLLKLLSNVLAENHKTFQDLTALALYKGPGSFTGLRIGATVFNTLAHELKIPIIGATGENWRAAAQTRLEKGENDRLILPLYGRPANITTPRK